MVPGNGGARDIVDQIQQDQVQRGHGQKRKKCACRQHGKHISEVGGGGHFNIFDHVGIGLSSFDDALFQHHQVLFQKDDRCGLFCDIYCRVNGDAYVRGLHGCGIIDPVSHVACAVPVFSQYTDDAGFLRRRQFGEYCDILCCAAQLLIIHLIQIAAHKDPVCPQAYLPAYGTGNLFVVTGQDLYVHSIFAESLNSCLCGSFRRIQKCKKSDQHHVAFILDRELSHGRRIGLLGDSDNPHSLFVQLIRLRKDKAAHLVCEWTDLSAAFCITAAFQHFFDCAFGDKLGLAVCIPDYYAHSASLEVEGDLVYLSVSADQLIRSQLLLL